jgi:DNA mismatch repair protein MSH3
MALPDLVVQALALTIRYLKEFGLERIICFGSSFHPFSNSVEMTLSANTLHQLEVFLRALF